MLNQVEIEDTLFSFSERAPSPPDRRHDTRHLKMLRVGTLTIGDRKELCLIRNISAGGVMAHVYSEIAVGARVEIALKTHEALPAKVVWTRDGNAGFQFDQPIDVEELLASPTVQANGWTPRMPRVEVDWLATVRYGAKINWVSLRDISQGGAKFESDEPLPIGAQVTVTIDKFRSMRGVVRWWEDGAGGIAFNDLVPFHELMSWLRPH